MPGLVPGIHVLGRARKAVNGRDKPGHDGTRAHPVSVGSDLIIPLWTGRTSNPGHGNDS
ncbi:hypothetical protein M2191_006897 [Bradyrhizobium japonicum]|nr:hypothetical protein [Bradyrhizobium japonicum]